MFYAMRNWPPAKKGQAVVGNRFTMGNMLAE